MIVQAQVHSIRHSFSCEPQLDIHLVIQTVLPCSIDYKYGIQRLPVLRW